MNKRTLSDSPLNLACLIATQVALIAAICPSANARDRFNAAHLETGDGGQAATGSIFMLITAKWIPATLSSACSKTRRG